LLGYVLLTSPLAISGAKKEKTRPVKLKDQTYEELLLFSPTERVVLAVRCEKTQFVHRRTRSERVILQTVVVAGPPERLEKPFSLSRFSQGDPLMKVGQTYLVAAYRGEWLPAWSLVEWVPVDPDEAAQAVKLAAAEVEKRAAGQR